MKTDHILPLILVVIVLGSCTKTIDFEEGDTEQQIIVNSILCPDSTFKVMLTKSQSILTNYYHEMVSNAEVTLFEDGAEVGLATEEAGYYKIAGFKPGAGKSYQLKIVAGEKQLQAETTIPQPVEMLETDTSTVKDEWGGEDMNIDLKFKDPSGEDYYRISVFQEQLYRSGNQDGSTSYYLNKTSYNFNANDPVFKSLYSNFGGGDWDIGPENDYTIFPDDLFNGKEYHIQIKTRFLSYSYPGMIYQKYIIHFQKISKDMFNFLKYSNLYDYYHDDPFSEPVPVYSNIQNGSGILAGLNDENPICIEKVFQPYSMDTIQLTDREYGGYGY